MGPSKLRLGDHLLALKLITPEQLEHALKIQRESPAPLGTILVSLGHISEDLLLNALAAQLGVSPWRLEIDFPTEAALKRLPPHLCRSHQVVPIKIKGDILILGMRNPHDIDAIDLVRNFTGMKIEPVLVNTDRLEHLLGELSGQSAHASRVDQVVDRALRDFNVDRRIVDTREKLNEEDTRPVVELVNQILLDAIRSGASDLHIEPRADRIEVRHRINGMLEPVRNIPRGLLPMLTTRLKIMGELDIVENRQPQDGRLAVTVDNRSVDLRMSVVPTQYGQRFVCRILDKALSVKKLSEIGFNDTNLTLFNEMIQSPYGIVLVTGPTGSGKTTTLYGALTELKKTSSNIMTAEDPVEYDIDGISQTQINERIGLTFGIQLRALLRQDPDTILVGEIRDTDTAQTAIRAALTGHLVLSTLHCNDAPSSIPRLLDMDVEPFLLSSALKGVVSQRLVRELCPHCRQAAKPNQEEVRLLSSYHNPNELPLLYQPKGCGSCANTGYRGRVAVHEVMPISGTISSMIAQREGLDRIKNEAQKFGYRSMTEYAIGLVLQGKTTLEEIRRMVQFDFATLEDDFEYRLAS